MKKRLKNALCAGAVLALLAWTVHTIFQQQTPGQLAPALLGADWRVLLLGVPLMALFLCCEAKATHAILRALGCAQPFRRCAYYSSVGFFFSTITPSATGGQPAQIVSMSKDDTPAASGALPAASGAPSGALAALTGPYGAGAEAGAPLFHFLCRTGDVLFPASGSVHRTTSFV